MLTEAIAVVEAVRALDPQQSPNAPGIYRFVAEPRHQGRLMRELAEALEAFDAAAGARRSPSAMLVRAIKFASDRGIPPAEMIGALQEGEQEQDDLRDAESLAELRPQPGEIGPPDKVSDSSPVPAPAPRYEDGGDSLAPKYMAPEPPAPIPALIPATVLASIVKAGPVVARSSVSGPLQRYVDEMKLDANIALADAGDYAADADMEMDAIGDRLAYVLGKYGLTPKLRILLAAYINARNRASVDMAAPGGAQMNAQDAGILAKVSADIRAIELNPSLAYPPGHEDELREEMQSTLPRPRPRP